jgi:hypothetical protein
MKNLSFLAELTPSESLEVRGGAACTKDIRLDYKAGWIGPSRCLLGGKFTSYTDILASPIGRKTYSQFIIQNGKTRVENSRGVAAQ